MFFLSQLEHKLRLPPHLLGLPLDEGIRGQLESVFLDKVIAKLGLCISVYDIKSIDGGFVLASEGAPTYTVVFRMIMFRPYVGEVIAAKVKESSLNGLRLSLGFFEDIYIPTYSLPKPSRAEFNSENPKQVTWVWSYEGEDFHIDDDFEIRFQVSDVQYPPIPLEQEENSKPFAPMVVTGLIDEDGLGPTAWWA